MSNRKHARFKKAAYLLANDKKRFACHAIQEAQVPGSHQYWKHMQCSDRAIEDLRLFKEYFGRDRFVWWGVVNRVNQEARMLALLLMHEIVNSDT